MSADLAALEEALGYQFRNRELLARALTHSSHAHEAAADSRDNEQLEFLGDAVLGFLASEDLVARYPLLREGPLSKLKAQLVSATHLSHVAEKLGLGQYLILGRGEERSGGRAKRALLANALEALIAAIFLDSGIDAARRFVARSVLAGFPEAEAGAITDFKSTLQELAQALKLPAPRYFLLHAEGPEHAKRFLVEARVGSTLAGRAEGSSKKSASQRAAQRVLEQLAQSAGP